MDPFSPGSLFHSTNPSLRGVLAARGRGTAALRAELSYLPIQWWGVFLSEIFLIIINTLSEFLHSH